MRVLPQVHEALRQNDPKMTSFSHPVVKKAPPTWAVQGHQPSILIQSLQGLVQ